MARVMVEQVFNEPLTDEYAELAKKLDPWLEARDGMWRRSSLSLDRKRLVCEFEAPDEESVRAAHTSAGIPCERIWGAHVFAIEDYPDLSEKLSALVAKNAASVH